MKIRKNFVEDFFNNFFVTFIESSETYAKQFKCHQNQSQTKLFNFCKRKISNFQKLKMKILLNERIFKNRKNIFAYVSKHWVSFGITN